MASFGERFRKIKQLFEGGEAEAEAPPLTPQRIGGAALRAEARKRRKRDMRERLEVMLRPDGSLVGGVVKFVNLDPIRQAVGDERWLTAFPKVELMSESIIRAETGPEDAFLPHNDQGFIIVFTDPELGPVGAESKCRAIFEAIRLLLLGPGVPVDIPDCTIDGRNLLAALESDAPLPLKVAVPAPVRQPVAPAATPAAAGAPIAGKPAPEGSRDDGWRPMFAAADRVAGDPDWQSDAGGKAAGEATGKWGASQDRDSVGGQWGDSRDRPDPEGRLTGNPTRGDPAAGGHDWGRSETKLDPQGRLIGDPTRGDPAAGGNDWGTSRDRAIAEGRLVGDPSRGAPVEGDPDWGESSDRTGSPDDPDWGRSQGRKAAMAGRMVTDGARPAPATPEVKLAAMGRAAAAQFAPVVLGYRGFWDVRHEAVTSYLAEPYLMEAGVTRGPAMLVDRARQANALAVLDERVQIRAEADLAERLGQGHKLLLWLPIAFATLTRKGDKSEFLERWAAVPEPMRRLTRFFCHEPSLELGDTPLSDILLLLRQIGREPIFTAPLVIREIDRLVGLKIQAIALDCLSLGNSPSAADQVKRVVGHARRMNVAVHIFGLATPQLRRVAVDAGAAFLDVKVARAADLPASPRKIPAAEAIGA